MTGLVTAGSLLAALPLLITLLLAGIELNRFKVHSERVAREGLVMAEMGTGLQETLKSMERSLRQYLVLGDSTLVPLVNRYLREADGTFAALEQLEIHDDLAAGLGSSRRDLQTLRQIWEPATKEGASPAASIIEAVDALRTQAEALVELGRLHTFAELRNLQAAAANVERAIIIAIAALTPLTVAFAYVVSLAVTKPLRMMNHGLAALGYGRYQRTIVIRYPYEMQRLGERLDWLRQRLAALELDKDRFLRQVSHELKTPLSSLQEGASLLLEGKLGALTPQQEEVGRILAEATLELGKLIDNLLAYAEWRREDRLLEMGWFDSLHLINEVCEAQRLSLQRKDLRLLLKLDAERLYGQRSRLKTALENLLSNAMKYAPPGTGVEIETSYFEDVFEMTVRDYGRGVPEAERQKIFDPFVRGAGSEEAGIRGTGVGLAIVRETMRAHGGSVEVEDADPGARFRMQWQQKPHDSH